jgi:hypothetical protein
MEQFRVEHKNTLLGLRSFKSKDTKLQLQGLQEKKKKNVEVWAFFIIDTCVWENSGRAEMKKQREL